MFKAHLKICLFLQTAHTLCAFFFPFAEFTSQFIKVCHVLSILKFYLWHNFKAFLYMLPLLTYYIKCKHLSQFVIFCLGDFGMYKHFT